MTIDEMKAELERAGYTIYDGLDENYDHATWAISPDHWEFEGKDLTQVVETAYLRLQEQRELVALRALLSDLWVTYEAIPYDMDYHVFHCEFCGENDKVARENLVHKDDCVYNNAMKYAAIESESEIE